MLLLIKLFLAHFVGDFVLQPKSWVEQKERLILRSVYLYIHLAVHGVLLFLLFGLNHWLLVVYSVISHGLVDVIKLHSQTPQNKRTWFMIDQVLHVLFILLIWYVYFNPEIIGFAVISSQFWIYTTAIVFITFVCSIVMQILLFPFSKSLEDPEDGSLRNAGKYIGNLERLFVFTFVVSGNWAAIGFLIAAKSVFRFGDLKESKDRKLTEYILIGTLLSFGIAMATGLIVLSLT